MNSVTNLEGTVTIAGNIITRHGIAAVSLGDIASDYGQVTVVYTGDGFDNHTFDVSAPMDEQDHWAYAGLIHRLNSENRLGKKLDTSDKGGDDTPPDGGTPGAANAVEFKNTLAIAA